MDADFKMGIKFILHLIPPFIKEGYGFTLKRFPPNPSDGS